MAVIVIKDLPESVELDREAMLAIAGGARTRGRQAISGHTLFRRRFVDRPARLLSGRFGAQQGQPAGGASRQA